MGFFDNVLKDNKSRVIISVIWGLGLAALFRKACKGRNCIVIRGPKPADLDNKIIMFDKKCYLYKSENTSCKNKIAN